MVIISNTIPPKTGIAIGIITSAPLPVEVSIGRSASMVVAVVIRHGLIRLVPAVIIASRISFVEPNFLLEKTSLI